MEDEEYVTFDLLHVEEQTDESLINWVKFVINASHKKCVDEALQEIIDELVWYPNAFDPKDAKWVEFKDRFYINYCTSLSQNIDTITKLSTLFTELNKRHIEIDETPFDDKHTLFIRRCYNKETQTFQIPSLEELLGGPNILSPAYVYLLLVKRWKKPESVKDD
jgi:hypothetical protein